MRANRGHRGNPGGSRSDPSIRVRFTYNTRHESPRPRLTPSPTPPATRRQVALGMSRPEIPAAVIPVIEMPLRVRRDRQPAMERSAPAEPDAADHTQPPTSKAATEADRQLSISLMPRLLR